MSRVRISRIVVETFLVLSLKHFFSTNGRKKFVDIDLLSRISSGYRFVKIFIHFAYRIPLNRWNIKYSKTREKKKRKEAREVEKQSG